MRSPKSFLDKNNKQYDMEYNATLDNIWYECQEVTVTTGKYDKTNKNSYRNSLLSLIQSVKEIFLEQITFFC
jgi:hypothetical protein